MAAYSYKDVVYRADFEETKKRWEEVNGECDNDANYDGHCWCVAAQLLDEKDAQIAKLTQDLTADRARIAQAIRKEHDLIFDARGVNFHMEALLALGRLLRVVEGK